MKGNLLLILLNAGLITIPAAAQSGNTFTVRPSVISSGGGTSSTADGTNRLISVIGQPAAGERLAGTNFVVRTGFFTAQFAPTSASVSVGGRISNSFGNGIPQALVIMTNQTGETKSVITNSFGFFRFNDVHVGETYIFAVSHKEYQFSPQVRTITEEITNLDFLALP